MVLWICLTIATIARHYTCCMEVSCASRALPTAALSFNDDEMFNMFIIILKHMCAKFGACITKFTILHNIWKKDLSKDMRHTHQIGNKLATRKTIYLPIKTIYLPIIKGLDMPRKPPAFKRPNAKRRQALPNVTRNVAKCRQRCCQMSPAMLPNVHRINCGRIWQRVNILL